MEASDREAKWAIRRGVASFGRGRPNQRQQTFACRRAELADRMVGSTGQNGRIFELRSVRAVDLGSARENRTWSRVATCRQTRAGGFIRLGRASRGIVRSRKSCGCRIGLMQPALHSRRRPVDMPRQGDVPQRGHHFPRSEGKRTAPWSPDHHTPGTAALAGTSTRPATTDRLLPLSARHRNFTSSPFVAKIMPSGSWSAS